MKKPLTLEILLTPTMLRRIAGNSIYARGADYEKSGMVQEVRLINDAIHAHVTGSSFPEYDVRLWMDDGMLGYDCSCPMGEVGQCCKHVVATGLAWQGREGTNKQKTAVRPTRITDDTPVLRRFLQKQNGETLTEWLLEKCSSDRAFRNELLTRALCEAELLDVMALKNAFDSALRTSTFTSYTQVRAMISQLESIISQVEQRAGDGHTAQVAELAEYAMLHGLATYMELDDSAGYFNGFLHELSDWYRESLQRAGAAWPLKGAHLFKLRSCDGWGFFHLDVYAPLLSKSEYQIYCKLAQAAWDRVPEYRDGTRECDSRDSAKHSSITRIMEEIATYENDFDQLIRIKSRQLTSPWAYLQVANTLQSAKRVDEALSMAERGLDAFAGEWDAALVMFVIDQYGQRGQHEQALDLTWRYFQQARNLAAFQLVKKMVRKGDWNVWWAKVLACMNCVPEIKRNRFSNYQRIEILLHEQDLEAALQAAQQDGATEVQWLRLARAYEKTHPQQAADIYCMQVGHIIDRKTNQAYAQAAGIIATIRGLMRALDQESSFVHWFASLYVRHKAKRNLMDKLAQQGLL